MMRKYHVRFGGGLGEKAITDLAYSLPYYFTSRNHLGAVNVKIAGIPVPTAKR